MLLSSIRRYSVMSSDTLRMLPMASSSAFTKAVVKAVQGLYPEKLADSSFDNTGREFVSNRLLRLEEQLYIPNGGRVVILESPRNESRGNRDSVLLTVDLTKAVADEAILGRHSVIIAYHPIIFRPLKSLTLANSQQNTLLRLAQEGISVYCPHTAVDAAPGGLNDWLADGITTRQSMRPAEGKDDFKERMVAHDRRVIVPIADIDVPGFEKAGYGRVVSFRTPQKLGDLLKRITVCLGGLPGISLAVPQSWPHETRLEKDISTVAICAGSGGSLLRDITVDLLFTGELSHHEALAAIERGQCVITAFHSNTERAFLGQRMRDALVTALRTTLEDSKGLDKTPGTVGDRMFGVEVSEVDRDPFEFIMTKDIDRNE